MHIRTLLLNPDFPACLHCGKHLARQTIANVPLRFLARIVRVFPFACEGCSRRIMAFTWPGRYVEWDGQILVMPDRDNPLRTFRSACRDHLFFYVFLVALCLLVAWSVLHGVDPTLRSPGIAAKP